MNTQAQSERIAELEQQREELLEALDIWKERAAWQPEKPPTVCPHCGKPASDVAYGGTCQMGGCPLGGDL